MELQYISDTHGNHTAVVIPIDDWKDITAKLEHLKDQTIDSSVKMSNAIRFKGILTNEETEKYQKFLKKARSEWDRAI